MPWGRAAVLGPLRTCRGSSTLGWYCCLGRQTVFHQSDVYAAGANAGRLGGGLVWSARCCVSADCVAQCYGVQPIDGNVVFRDEIAVDRFCHPLRALDAEAASRLPRTAAWTWS